MSRTNTVILIILITLILLVGYQQSQLDNLKQHVTTQAFVQACATNLVYRNTVVQERGDEEKLPQENSLLPPPPPYLIPPIIPTSNSAHEGKSNDIIPTRVESPHLHFTTSQCSTWNI